MKICEITAQQFTEFQKNFSIVSFVQSPENQKIMKTQAQDALLLGFFDQGKMIGAGLFVIKRTLKILKFAHCNQGPLFLPELEKSPKKMTEIMQELRKFFAKKKVFKVIFTPNLDLNLRDINGKIIEKNVNKKWLKTLQKSGLKWEKPNGEMINGVGRFFFVKDFSRIKNEADLMKSFDQKTRNLVRKSEKMMIETREVKNKKDLKIFKQIMENTAARRGFRDRDFSYYENFLKNFGKNVRILLAGIEPRKSLRKIEKNQREKLAEEKKFLHNFPDFAADKKLLNQRKILREEVEILEKRKREISELETEKFVAMSGAVFVNYGGEITYLFSGNYEKFMKFAPSYALQFAAQKWAIERGAKIYNFYGTTGKFSGNSDDGIYVFKKGFGGKVVEQVGNFDLVVRPFWNFLFNFVSFLRKL